MTTSLSQSEKANRSSGLTLAHWLPLLGLTCAAFVFNTSEFMPVGLLTDIGSTFSLSEATTGLMISIYAWAVMLLSMPLMVFASRFDFKRMMLGVVTIFALGQFLSALAPTFPLLVASRLVVACAHAVFWSVASIMATRLVDAEHGPLAISMIATGSSIAQIAGLPIGRAIGLAIGWRMTFLLVGVVAVAVVVYQTIVFPPMAAGEPFSMGDLPTLFKNRFLVALYVVTIFMATGYYVAYSYIGPFLQQVGGIAPGLITISLAAFGVAGLIGSWLFGRFFDGHRRGFLACMLGGAALALFLIRFTCTSIVGVFVTFILWGICETAFNIAFQAELIDHTELDQSSVAMSIFSGLFNLGIGTGTAIGGAVVSGIGIASIGIVGGIVAAMGVVLTFAWMLREL